MTDGAEDGWFARLQLDDEPALLLGAGGALLDLNPAAARVQAACGADDARQLLPGNHLQLLQAALQQGRTVGPVIAEVGGRSLRWKFVPLPGAARVLARGQDASAQLRDEREAARARRLYRLIIENTADLISRHSPDGRFVDAAPASWSMLGYWPEELRGRPVRELLHPDDLAQMREARERLERLGHHSLSYRLRHRDGHYLWVETSCRAIRETYTGAVVEIVCVTRDISARLRAEAELRRHQDELAHAARLVTLGELASGIAHEINQPLAAVVNYAAASQRYLRGAGSDPQALARVAEGLERITAHANHAAEVIRRLRAFLRKGQRRVQALNVAAVARDAVQLCAWEAERARVAIRDDLPDNLPPLYADRVLLEQVLLNLLRNAIEANREAHPGAPSTVRLAARPEAGGLCVTVQDQGPGVSEEALAQLFTPFYTSKADGLGLGLAMSRSIVEGFGGELWAERQASGLRLCCRLPLAGGEAGQRERGE
ncbi:PAS domain S-box protein [Pseudomonas stutzeri]|nr:PAS domain S-box protein [Stutzerimonas stutzeri]